MHYVLLITPPTKMWPKWIKRVRDLILVIKMYIFFIILLNIHTFKKNIFFLIRTNIFKKNAFFSVRGDLRSAAPCIYDSVVMPFRGNELAIAHALRLRRRENARFPFLVRAQSGTVPGIVGHVAIRRTTPTWHVSDMFPDGGRHIKCIKRVWR